MEQGTVEKKAQELEHLNKLAHEVSTATRGCLDRLRDLVDELLGKRAKEDEGRPDPLAKFPEGCIAGATEQHLINTLHYTALIRDELDRF